MNRNTNSPFANVPQIDINRSKFEMDFNHKTTGNTGDLIPFYVDMDILPGDTHKIETASVIRSMTPLKPVMDLAYADIYYFFVPNRIIWDHWKQLMGEQEFTAWVETTEYTVPQLKTPTTGVTKGSIADYMGIPNGALSVDVSALPFRAYINIVNNWFRDQNLIAPLPQYTDDTNRTMDMTKTELGGPCFKIAKSHDYFTSALPQPARPLPGTSDPNIRLPLGITAPVIGNGISLGWTDGTNNAGTSIIANEGIMTRDGNYGVNNGTATTGLSGLSANVAIGITTDPTKSGLIADLTNATASTINALRLAFQTQKLMEASARGGNRYRELIRSEFNTTIPDSTVQIAEYLGGKRIQINQSQVEDSANNLGNTGAFSLTNDADESFTKSFTEHGIILGLIAIRTLHTYQQGINKSWFKKRKLEFYTPVFAHLGEQPIYNREIYCTGNTTDTQVFGYQEAWAEYRYKPNRISGEMRSSYGLSLDVWHYGDDFSSLPTLGPTFISETTANVARTLAVTTQDQWLFDIAVRDTAVRPMPINSVPGLIDHF